MAEMTTKKDFNKFKRKDTEENNSGPNKKRKHNYLLVYKENNLQTRMKELSEATATEAIISVDCEGVELSRKGSLTLISVGTRKQVYLFDVLILKDAIFDSGLRVILENESVKKLMFDCREDADALKHQFNVTIRGVLDIQLLEVIKRPRQSQYIYTRKRSQRDDEVVRLYSLLKCLEEYTQEEKMIQNKKELNALMQSKSWESRPLTSSLLNYASADVSSLFTLYDKFDPNDEENDRWKVASDLYVDLKRTMAERKYDMFEKNGYLPIDIIPEKTLTFERGNVECTTCHIGFPRSEFSTTQMKNEIQKCRTCKKVKYDDDKQKKLAREFEEECMRNDDMYEY